MQLSQHINALLSSHTNTRSSKIGWDLLSYFDNYRDLCILIFKDLEGNPFENNTGKEENAGNQHFLLFPCCFLPFSKINFNFSVSFILSCANSFDFDWSKILSFSKELRLGLEFKLSKIAVYVNIFFF